MNFDDISDMYLGTTPVDQVYLGTELIWPKETGLPIGTTFDFDYTGTVQSIDLPKGYYKLQAWGAQGGPVTGTYAVKGSKGGYSEGILKLDSPKTLYVFVGGRGASYTSSASQTSTTLINGGWNGGGCGARTCLYNSTSDGEYGVSFPRPGGGATDFAWITSDMSYSNNRTNRSTESLNSRILVAGGGAGASAYYYEVDTYDEETVYVGSFSGSSSNGLTGNSTYPYYRRHYITSLLSESGTYMMDYSSISGSGATLAYINYEVHLTSPWTKKYSTRITAGSTFNINLSTYPTSEYTHEVTTFSTSSGSMAPYLNNAELYKIESTGSTNSGSGVATLEKQGGGTSGRGQYPGTQSSAGTGGGFGYGANQTSTNYMYCGGGGGGGWYGGGTSCADIQVNYVNYCGGGSGYVSSELLSGYTKAGNVSFPSKTSGSETGHSGNGFARITVVDENGEGGSGGGSGTPSIEWIVQAGTWTALFDDIAYDGLTQTSNMYTDSGSTVIRCTFSGITSITFYCTQDSELNYDYLTLGYLDSNCTRSSYQYSMKGKTSNTYTYTCDTGEHYIEFCYSKDGSVSNGSDSATVYISAVS